MMDPEELASRVHKETLAIQTATGEKMGNIYFSFSMTISGLAFGFIKGWLMTLFILAAFPGGQRMMSGAEELVTDRGTLVLKPGEEFTKEHARMLAEQVRIVERGRPWPEAMRLLLVVDPAPLGARTAALKPQPSSGSSA